MCVDACPRVFGLIPAVLMFSQSQRPWHQAVMCWVCVACRIGCQILSYFAKCIPIKFFYIQTCSRELRTQKLKSHPMRTQSLNVLPLKPGVGQYIAIHATLTAMDFFLAYFYPFGPFICIFPNLSRFFLCWVWLTHGSCVGPQNKIGHPGECRFPCWVPAEYK